MTEESGGSDPAFVVLFQREFPIAAHAAYSVTGSDARAQDIAQEALAVAYKKWDSVKDLERPGAWVRRVAINMAITDRRRAARQQLRAEVPEPEPVAGPSHEDRSVLADAVRGLPVQQRLAVVLHYFHDLPVADVAQSLGCAENTAKVHLHRARLNLATILDDDVNTR